MKLGWTEVSARIAAGDSTRTERKFWDVFPHGVAGAIAALANADGGFLILGVADDGSLVGVPGDVKEVLEKL